MNLRTGQWSKIEVAEAFPLEIFTHCISFISSSEWSNSVPSAVIQQLKYISTPYFPLVEKDPVCFAWSYVLHRCNYMSNMWSCLKNMWLRISPCYCVWIQVNTAGLLWTRETCWKWIVRKSDVKNEHGGKNGSKNIVKNHTWQKNVTCEKCEKKFMGLFCTFSIPSGKCFLEPPSLELLDFLPWIPSSESIVTL